MSGKRKFGGYQNKTVNTTCDNTAEPTDDPEAAFNHLFMPWVLSVAKTFNTINAMA